MEDSPQIHNPDVIANSNPGENWQELAPPLPPLGILAGLSDASLLNLAAYGRYAQVQPGEKIINEGESQDRFYVVVSGRLSISAFSGGTEIPLSTAETGECLGEVSLLEPGPASASVSVVDESVLWSMNLDNLRTYLAEHAGGGGALLMGMAQCLSQRLREANMRIGKHATPQAAVTYRQDRVITADNTPVQIGFFDKLKKSMGSDKKVKISTEIKM